MHPALSIIFFTTLSGAGYGLLAWLGLSLAWSAIGGSAILAAPSLQLAALVLGLALSTVGLLSSLGHLGQPRRAWRALSQWRTSWLSREGVLALLTTLPALAIGAVLLAPGPGSASPSAFAGAIGGVLALLALATVACTAMIYASLKPIPAWRHALVAPIYLLFALLTGLALSSLLTVLMVADSDLDAADMLAAISGLAVLLMLGKWLYWRDIDAATLPATRADAVGLPGRTVSVFERPHTEANYITREMAFVVARAHARKLRLLAGGLVLLAPLLAWGLAVLLGVGSAPWLLGLAVVGTLAGAFVERWLFFAQARHIVTLYY